jgi:hypothetical protein
MKSDSLPPHDKEEIHFTFTAVWESADPAAMQAIQRHLRLAKKYLIEEYSAILQALIGKKLKAKNGTIKKSRDVS